MQAIILFTEKKSHVNIYLVYICDYKCTIISKMIFKNADQFCYLKLNIFLFILNIVAEIPFEIIIKKIN